MIDEENFLLHAGKSYYNPRCNSIEDFYSDLQRLKYIKRLINRYVAGGALSERLILNHLIVFCNSFGLPGSIDLLEFRINKSDWKVLKPFLTHLRYISENSHADIVSDPIVIEKLRCI